MGREDHYISVMSRGNILQPLLVEEYSLTLTATEVSLESKVRWVIRSKDEKKTSIT